MDIDMAALRALEREKDISFDVVVEAIETALLSAYHKTARRPRARAGRARPQERARHGMGRERLEAEPLPEPAEGEEPPNGRPAADRRVRRHA